MESGKCPIIGLLKPPPLLIIRFAAEQDRRRRLRPNLRSTRHGHERTCGVEARVNETSETSSKNGSDRAETLARQRPCVSVHRRRYDRAFQLCGDESAGQEFGRAEARPTQTVLLVEQHAASRRPNSNRHPKHPHDWLLA